MLCMTSYSQDYVDTTRAAIDSQVAAYDALITKARSAAREGDSELADAIAGFEPLFFGHLVMALDNYFLHRGRAQEGKDGNPLNEVRILCSSLSNNDGLVTRDNTIKMDPATSVLGYDPGDRISLTQEDFLRLAKAFLAEIAIKFPG